MAKSKLQGGADPATPPAGDRTVETIRSFIVEGRDLGPEDYRAEIVPMIVALASPTTSDSDTFRALKTFNFMVSRIRGLLQLLAPFDEALAWVSAANAANGVGNPTPEQRRLIKAMNCRLTLQNTDRNQDVFDGAAMPLSAIMPELGGALIDLSEAPHILPGGEQFQMTATLVQGNSNATDNTTIIGANTEYGLSLEGYYVRVRKG